MKLAKKSKAFLVLLLLISFTTVSVASEPTVTKLKKGDKVPFQAKECIHTLRLIHSIYASVEKGRKVCLSEQLSSSKLGIAHDTK